MRYIRTLKSIITWVIYVLIVWLSKIASILVSPVGALFVEKDEQGFTQFKWKWMSTHDTHADTYWTNEKNRDKFLLKGRTQEDWDNKAWLRWACRVYWVFRNPAYVVADKLGYNQKGMKFLYQKDNGHLWDSGYPNFSFYLAENEDKQIGWMLEWQWYFYKQNCLEVYLGWKLFRNDPNQRCMIVGRITPFKKYNKKW